MERTVIVIGVVILLSLFCGNNAQAAKFNDVPSHHWAKEAVGQSVEAGILQGYDGKFHGNKTLNRYEIAVIVARLLDKFEEASMTEVDTKEEEERLAAITDVLKKLRQELTHLNERTDAIEADLVAYADCQ